MNRYETDHPLKLMVVDDEPIILELFKSFINTMKNIEFHGFSSPNEALSWAKSNSFHIALVDYVMPGMRGLELISVLKSKSPDSYYLLMTAYGEFEIAIEAIRVGIFDFIPKPVEKKDLELAIERVAKHKKLKDQNVVLQVLLKENYGKGELVGHSHEIATIREKIMMFAESEAPVLVTGETGVGKEVAARMIHGASSRNNARFVAVNCSAYAETLLESELFGHEKGAFTGAQTQRKGRLEFAQTGSILLDEVCEIPPQIQVKLLRVLQEKEFERVGGNEPIPLKARLISATNRNVDEEIRRGRFRDDLYYRLNTLHLHIPPLRKRQEDIIPLASRFLKKFSLIHNKEVASFSDTVTAIFHSHPWPGNVRQLENVIDYAVLSCDGDKVREEHLPEELSGDTMPIHSASAPPRTTSHQSGNIPDIISGIEKEKIVATLEKYKWNKSKTARELGFTRGQLLYRLKKYGIE